MPIHDWTRVEAGIFHDFHQKWARAIKPALNSGLLPPDYYALLEQVAGRSRRDRLPPDLLTLRGPDGANGRLVLGRRPGGDGVCGAGGGR